MKVVQAFTEGHPDKVCDQIADAIVDEYLRRDPESRIGITVMGSHGMLMIGGEVVSEADFDIGELAKQVYKEIGYTDDIEPFVNVETVDRGGVFTKGARGTVFVNGYATRETREFLPRPVVLANALARRLDELRKNNPSFSWIRPDGKIQLVTDKGSVKCLTVLLQHDDRIEHTALQQKIYDSVIVPILGELNGANISVNPIGCFANGGLGYDTGASNRKIASDTYGGLIPFGSGILSGKDPGRTERCGAYMARFVAKQLVKEGLAKNCLVRLAYSLGIPEPVYIEVRSGDGKDMTALAKSRYNFETKAIVERLDLRKPIYRRTATYGHFGKEGLPWE